MPTSRASRRKPQAALPAAAHSRIISARNHAIPIPDSLPDGPPLRQDKSTDNSVLAERAVLVGLLLPGESRGGTRYDPLAECAGLAEAAGAPAPSPAAIRALLDR